MKGVTIIHVGRAALRDAANGGLSMSTMAGVDASAVHGDWHKGCYRIRFRYLTHETAPER
jgi:hypothetical protein